MVQTIVLFVAELTSLFKVENDVLNYIEYISVNVITACLLKKINIIIRGTNTVQFVFKIKIYD